MSYRVYLLSPVLLSRFSLAICFVPSSVYMSISIFAFISPLFSPLGAHMFVLYLCEMTSWIPSISLLWFGEDYPDQQVTVSRAPSYLPGAFWGQDQKPEEQGSGSLFLPCVSKAWTCAWHIVGAKSIFMVKTNQCQMKLHCHVGRRWDCTMWPHLCG